MTDLPSSKACTYCQCEKPLAEFGKHKMGKHGLNPQCKQCNRERVAAYQARHGGAYKARKLAYDKQRWADGYGRNEEWRVANRVRLNAAKAEWARANPEKSRMVKLAHKHRRRAQEAGGLSWSDLRRWRNAQLNCCYWCGDKQAKEYTIDHYVPLAKGGKHVVGNLVIACRPCNVRKSAKDPLVFAKQMGRLL